MYQITEAQEKAEKTLQKQGFRFANWINAFDEENPNHGCIVMTRKPKSYMTEYREIDPQGNIN